MARANKSGTATKPAGPMASMDDRKSRDRDGSPRRHSHAPQAPSPIIARRWRRNRRHAYGPVRTADPAPRALATNGR